MVHCGKGFITVFPGFLASVGEIFIVAGEWALGIILRHLDTLLIFPNFLIEALTCLATSEATCSYHVYKQQSRIFSLVVKGKFVIHEKYIHSFISNTVISNARLKSAKN